MFTRMLSQKGTKSSGGASESNSTSSAHFAQVETSTDRKEFDSSSDDPNGHFSSNSTFERTVMTSNDDGKSVSLATTADSTSSNQNNGTKKLKVVTGSSSQEAQQTVDQSTLSRQTSERFEIELLRKEEAIAIQRAEIEEIKAALEKSKGDLNAQSFSNILRRKLEHANKELKDQVSELRIEIDRQVSISRDLEFQLIDSRDKNAQLQLNLESNSSYSNEEHRQELHRLQKALEDERREAERRGATCKARLHASLQRA